jgi:hypothetical protein
MPGEAVTGPDPGVIIPDGPLTPPPGGVIGVPAFPEIGGSPGFSTTADSASRGQEAYGAAILPFGDGAPAITAGDARQDAAPNASADEGTGAVSRALGVVSAPAAWLSGLAGSSSGGGGQHSAPFAQAAWLAVAAAALLTILIISSISFAPDVPARREVSPG